MQVKEKCTMATKYPRFDKFVLIKLRHLLNRVDFKKRQARQ